MYPGQRGRISPTSCLFMTSSPLYVPAIFLKFSEYNVFSNVLQMLPMLCEKHFFFSLSVSFHILPRSGVILRKPDLLPTAWWQMLWSGAASVTLHVYLANYGSFIWHCSSDFTYLFESRQYFIFVSLSLDSVVHLVLIKYLLELSNANSCREAKEIENRNKINKGNHWQMVDSLVPGTNSVVQTLACISFALLWE